MKNETTILANSESKRFSELSFSERNHLQEWLAYQPDALGKERLIMQTEFDGYNTELKARTKYA